MELELELHQLVKASYSNLYESTLYFGILEIIGIEKSKDTDFVQFIAKVIFPDKHKNLHLTCYDCKIIKNFGLLDLDAIIQKYPEYLI